MGGRRNSVDADGEREGESSGVHARPPAPSGNGGAIRRWECDVGSSVSTQLLKEEREGSDR